MSEQWGQTPVDGGYGGGFGVPGQPGYGYLPPRTSKLAIASLVLGVVSLPMIAVAVFGPLVALVGLILGIIGIAGAARKNLKRGIGVAGIVLCVLGLIGGGLVTVVAVHAANACASISRSDTTAYNDCIKHNLKF